MSKFSLGNPVRVITDHGLASSYFDVVGVVDDLLPERAYGIGVHFESLAPLWFAEHELVLAEAAQ